MVLVVGSLTDRKGKGQGDGRELLPSIESPRSSLMCLQPQPQWVGCSHTVPGYTSAYSVHIQSPSDSRGLAQTILGHLCILRSAASRVTCAVEVSQLYILEVTISIFLGICFGLTPCPSLVPLRSWRQPTLLPSWVFGAAPSLVCFPHHQHCPDPAVPWMVLSA